LSVCAFFVYFNPAGPTSIPVPVVSANPPGPVTAVSANPPGPVTAVSANPSGPVTAVSANSPGPVTAVSANPPDPVTAVSANSPGPVTVVSPDPSGPIPRTRTIFAEAEVFGVKITDAKIATGLNEQLMPIQVTDVFPRDTRQVFCWFSWSDAIPKMEMKVVWNYEIDDIKVLTYDFRVPRKKGSGGISLTLPIGKVLPLGSYRVDIIAQNKVLKSLTFKVK
jgi:hypothetical protein